MTCGTPTDQPGNALGPCDPDAGAPGRAARPSWPGDVSFDLGCILQATWLVYRQRPGQCIGLCGTVLVLTVAAQLLPLRWLSHSPDPQGRWSLFLGRFAIFFAGYVFSTWLGLGQRLALLALLHREPGAVGNLFRGGRYVLTTLLAGFLLVLVIGVLILGCVFPGALAGSVLGPLASLRPQADALAISLSLVLAAYVALRCSQFAYVIVDRDAGAIEALVTSWEATRSRVLSLSLVYMLWLAINLGGLLLYGVGIFLTVPFTSLMLAVTYVSLTGLSLDGREAEREGDGRGDASRPGRLGA